MKNNKLLKKLAKIFGALFVIFVLAALIIPFVVDVDQYRPKIVELVNQKINGKLELGKLKLSLWGSIDVNVDGVILTAEDDTEILSVKNSYLNIPFTSIFTGSPRITFVMKKPMINVVSDRQGKMNILKIMKDTTEEKTSSASSASSANNTDAPIKEKDSALPSFLVGARLGLDLENATVKYSDLKMGLDNQVTDLNVLIKDLSLSRETEYSIWGQLDTKMGKTLTVKGPFKIEGKQKVQFKSQEDFTINAEITANVDDLEIHSGSAFHKKSGIPANLLIKANAHVMRGSQAKEDVVIEQIKIQFHNIELLGDGKLTNPSSQSPVINIKIAAKEFDLAPWSQLIPALKEYELSGKTKFEMKAWGEALNPQYAAQFVADRWSAESGLLKEKPVMNAFIDVVTDHARKIQVSLNTKTSDFKLLGSVKNFKAPHIQMKIDSNLLDLDQMFKLPPPSRAETAQAAQTAKTGGEVAGVSDTKKKSDEADYDQMLDPLRESKSLQQAKVDLEFNFKKINVYGIAINNTVLDFNFKNLVGNLKKFQTHLWDGSLFTSASFNLKPKHPTYSLSSNISKLDLKKAVTSQLQMFKNTVYGNLNFQMKGSGSSLNPDLAQKNLNVNGSFNVTQAEFTNIDVGKMAVEAVNKAVDSVAQKVPALGKRKVNELPERRAKYEFLKSSFSMSKGLMVAPDFYGKSEPNKGLDIQGRTELNFVSKDIRAKWQLIDVYNLTKAADISVTQAGTTVPRLLASGNPNLVRIPVSVDCQFASPCYTYTEVPEHFVSVALSNVGNAAKQRLQSEAKQKAQQQIQKVIPKSAPKPVQDALKRLKF